MIKSKINKIKTVCALTSALAIMPVFGQNVAYIHGDVAANGNIPSGNAAPFHQMLLTDTGIRGTSEFRSVVESEGYQIEQFYDQSTTLTNAFLNQYDVIVFGLHQRVWSAGNLNRLNNWINAGGSILVYSDSAAGGRFNQVGSDNTVGQTAVNNIITRYGMQVTVDQADGIIANSSGNSNHPIVAGNLVLEGEGVSPVAVDPNSGAEILIPYQTNVVSGNASLNRVQNITINNPTYAALAIQNVGSGHVVAMYDRQPVWNNGEGSDITRRDNRTILRNIMRFLADDLDAIIGDPGPATGIGATIAATTYDAESNPNQNNIIREVNGAVGFTRNNSWIRFDDFEFPGRRRYDFTITASSGNAGGAIEIRQDSPTGRVLTTIQVPNTGGFQNFQTFTGRSLRVNFLESIKPAMCVPHSWFFL